MFGMGAYHYYTLDEIEIYLHLKAEQDEQARYEQEKQRQGITV